jgi:hypothetical protein
LGGKMFNQTSTILIGNFSIFYCKFLLFFFKLFKWFWEQPFKSPKQCFWYPNLNSPSNTNVTKLFFKYLKEIFFK